MHHRCSSTCLPSCWSLFYHACEEGGPAALLPASPRVGHCSIMHARKEDPLPPHCDAHPQTKGRGCPLPRRPPAYRGAVNIIHSMQQHMRLCTSAFAQPERRRPAPATKCQVMQSPAHTFFCPSIPMCCCHRGPHVG
jgi:hypothetical protein